MFSTKIKVDINKLNGEKSCSGKKDKNLSGSREISITLTYFDETSYKTFVHGLNEVLSTSSLSDHANEVLYLILQEYEALCNRYYALLDDYEEVKKSKEIASFLLAYLKRDKEDDINLGLQVNGKTTKVRDSSIIDWMFNCIYDKLERLEFSFTDLGTNTIRHFLSSDFEDSEITIERLERIVGMKLQNPKGKLVDFFFDMCMYLREYLINNTHLTIPKGKKLTDAHANLYFAIWELLGYVDSYKVAMPKDYIYSRFSDYLKNRKNLVKGTEPT